MDISQLVVIAVAVVGTVIVGLLAVVPTFIELPRGRRADRSADQPIAPPPAPRDRPHDGPDHRLAA